MVKTSLTGGYYLNEISAGNYILSMRLWKSKYLLEISNPQKPQVSVKIFKFFDNDQKNFLINLDDTKVKHLQSAEAVLKQVIPNSRDCLAIIYATHGILTDGIFKEMENIHPDLSQNEKSHLTN